MPDRNLDAERKNFEAALASLTPSRVAIDRDRLMYDAGCVAGRRDDRRRRFTSAFVCGAAALLVGRYLGGGAGPAVSGESASSRAVNAASLAGEAFAPSPDAAAFFALRLRCYEPDAVVADAVAPRHALGARRVDAQEVDRNDPTAIDRWLRELN